MVKWFIPIYEYLKPKWPSGCFIATWIKSYKTRTTRLFLVYMRRGTAITEKLTFGTCTPAGNPSSSCKFMTQLNNGLQIQPTKIVWRWILKKSWFHDIMPLTHQLWVIGPPTLDLTGAQRNNCGPGVGSVFTAQCAPGVGPTAPKLCYENGVEITLG